MMRGEQGELVTIVVILLLLIGCVPNKSSPPISFTASTDAKPNILMILVDDMGYTDLGLYGGEISTPNIDELGRQGIAFSNAHVNPSCAPTRASLMTGQDPHRVGLGSQNGVTPPGVPVTRPGYKGSLEGEFIGLADIMNQGGYDTFHVGKWHLGRESEQLPGALGFDRYFALLDGAASHYSDRTGVGISVSPSGHGTYLEDGEEVEALPESFYSTYSYTQWLIDALDQRQSRARPFFAYLAYTAVHDPLHAPDDLISKYAAVFTENLELVKEQRTLKLEANGLIRAAKVESRWLRGTRSWATMTETQQRDMIRRMAVHAAMLDYLDQQVGRLVSYLDESDELDITMIVVMSDNGAATVPRTFYANSADELDWQRNAYPLDRLEGYGKQGSFATLGTYNAQVVAGPYFGFKTNLHEGGTRVPMVVKPAWKYLGSVHHGFVHISDLYSTFAEYAQVDVSNQKALTGCSLKPLFEGLRSGSCHVGFGMGYMGWRAYWAPPWKLVFVSESFGGTGQYALYNLESDPGEVHDLAADFPEKVAELSQAWETYAENNGVVQVPMTDVNGLFDRISKKFFEIYWGQ